MAIQISGKYLILHFSVLLKTDAVLRNFSYHPHYCAVTENTKAKAVFTFMSCGLSNLHVYL